MSDDRWTVEQVEASLGEPLREEVVVSASDWSGLLLTALDALKAQPRWVAVEERLPEEPGLYCVRVLDISLGDEPTHNAVPSWEHYDDEAEEWQLSEDWFPVECWRVTHWMPLPPLPEEDGDA